MQNEQTVNCCVDRGAEEKTLNFSPNVQLFLRESQFIL